MRSVDFNAEAMESKVEKNLKKGFDTKGIHVALMQEYLNVLERIKPLQIRAIELSDQIDYMKEKHPIQKEKPDETG